MSSRQHFETAVEQVAGWLDAASGVQRCPSRRADGAAAWDLDLVGDVAHVPWVRLVLPTGFPSETCWFEVDPDLALKLPHVERSGKVCIRIHSAPGDYEDPIGAAMRAIAQLKSAFLLKLAEPEWLESEFHRERATYWASHCADGRRPTRIDRGIGFVHLDAQHLDGWADGLVAGFLRPKTKHGYFLRQVVTCNGVEPLDVANRHGWSGGTVVKGHALVVRLPESHQWTPSTWPRTSQALDELIKSCTGGERSLERLVASGRKTFERNAGQPKFQTGHRGAQVAIPHAAAQLFVIFVQQGAAFGYQLRPTIGLERRGLAIEPFIVNRIDADWALARDHSLGQLHERRVKRVLLLGAGSLGSPVAHLLARSGIGELTIIDKDLMEAENTARHMLGMPHIEMSKAPQLAEELRRLVPNLTVTGINAEACAWLPKFAKPGDFDLVVDCTAESVVRSFIAVMRGTLLGATPVVHAWIEPLCSAGHVVLTTREEPWPVADPADERVHASDLSAEATRVEHPACSAGFHPYGAADVTQVAAFAAERILLALSDTTLRATVWSWVRSQAFFDALGMPIRTRPIVPQSESPLDTVTLTRSLSRVLEPR